jgi:hypothetical protein
MSEGNFQLSHNWTLWFHKIDDANWTIDSYINIMSFNDMIGFMTAYNTIKKYMNQGLFFLMKNDIPPIWESPENINGSAISIITGFDINTELLTYMIGICGDDWVEDMSKLNGLSITPKYKKLLIKIWTNDLTPLNFSKNVPLKMENVKRKIYMENIK